jgi:hypothetical protein
MSDHSEPKQFTAEDFEDAIAAATDAAKSGEAYRYDAIAFAALRIAANVMRQGVIEAAMEFSPEPEDTEVAAAIRKALTDG